MPRRQELGFNVTALDNASRTFVRMASQVERLQERLNRLDRKDVTVDVNANTSNARREIRRVNSAISQIESGFARFSEGITGVIAGVARLGPLGVVALGTVAASALAAAGAITALASAATAMAAGVVGAVAGIGIGAALYAQTARGEAALQRFKQRAQMILTDTAQPLFTSFDFALRDINTMLDQLRPTFRAVFSSLGGAVREFSSSATRALTSLGPVIGSIAQAATGFAAGFSSTFDVIARQLEPALARLAPTLRTVGTLMGARLGQMLADLLPRIVDLGRRALPLLQAALIGAHWALSALVGLGNALINAMGGMVVGINKGRIAMNQFALTAVRLADVLPGVNTSLTEAGLQANIMRIRATNAGISTQLWGQRTQTAATQQQGLATATNRTRRALQNYQETILSSLEGQIAYRRQLDRTAEELQKGATSFNLNTQEGRENASAVVDLINKSRDQIETFREQGRTTDFITGKTQQFTRELFQEARQAGFTDEQIRDLIVSSDNIPKSVKQRITTTADTARGQVENLIGATNRIPRHIQTTIDIATTGVPAAGALGSLGDVRFRQHGGSVRRLRPYVVGEAGPELFVPRQSGTIVSNDEATSGGLQPLINNLTVTTTPNASAGQIIDEVMHNVRVASRGGVRGRG